MLNPLQSPKTKFIVRKSKILAKTFSNYFPHFCMSRENVHQCKLISVNWR